jgi:hypothetical protein
LLHIHEEPLNQKQQPNQQRTLKPGFSNCSLNTPISEPCREFFALAMEMVATDKTPAAAAP